MTPNSLTITVGGEKYTCSFSDSHGVLWANVQTNDAPTAQLAHELNRRLINEHAEDELNAWGKHYLPQYVARLTALHATNDDFERLGLHFLIQSDEGKQARPRSPLHVLGYQVWKSGLPENARQEILRNAVTEELPNVGTAEYMASWGLPNTRRRVMAIILYLVGHLSRAGKPNSDYSKTVADWESDISWMKEEFFDLASQFPDTPTGWRGNLVISHQSPKSDPV